jgi:hypothetical protein
LAKILYLDILSLDVDIALSQSGFKFQIQHLEKREESVISVAPLACYSRLAIIEYEAEAAQ